MPVLVAACPFVPRLAGGHAGGNLSVVHSEGRLTSALFMVRLRWLQINLFTALRQEPAQSASIILTNIL